MKIKILNVSRKYVIKDKKEFYALKDVTLMFDDVGFTSIVGKSGSGKSTLLNLIGGLDRPSKGSIYIYERCVSDKKKQRDDFYKKYIGILFQSYNLIEDESTLYNVMLPALIAGVNKEEARLKAVNLLKEVGINSKLFDKKAGLLSGGEKQRVSFARSIICEPEILLCDEPTGALDSESSTMVIELLKQYSKKHLVIMVSHNLQIVDKYSDRIIKIKEGKIIEDQIVKKQIFHQPNSRKCSRGIGWITKLFFSGFKKHIKRNILTALALSITLVFSFLAVGYVYGKDAAIEKAGLRQLDYGVGTISKEDKLSTGTLLSLTRTTRPNLEELYLNSSIVNNYEICLNFDGILQQNQSISYDGEIFENISFNPIYDFDDKHIDFSLISSDSSRPYSTNQILINDKAYDYIKELIHKDPITETIDFQCHAVSTFADFDETVITDELDISLEFEIVGVVKELSYLNTPKIYYSYCEMYDYLSDCLLDNLTTYTNTEISWIYRLESCEDFDALSSYSYRLFPKDISNVVPISVNDPLSFSSPSLIVKDSLYNFMDVAKYGIILFLIITLIGTALIFGILSFTSYSEDRKKSAILSCLGARDSEITDIYLCESLSVGVFSLLISSLLAFGLSFLVNSIVYKLIDIENVISIPFASLWDIPLFFPVLALIVTLLLCALCTYLPILFSKHISLKEELQSL